MARSIEVKILGDATNLQRSFKKAEESTTAFGRASEKVSGQIEKQQRSMEHLHKVAFGLVGTLVGAGGLEVGLKSVIEAARKAQESQDHLAVTMKDAGLSYEAAGKQVEAFIRKQSDLAAFQQTDLRESFGSLVRATKDTQTAMRDTALAADIARGRHIDLAAATNLVIKAQIGMTGSLRRMGIDIQPVHTAVNALTDSHQHFTAATREAAKAMDQHATALKAIDTLSRSYAGNAKAYGESSAGAADKFKVSLQNLQIAIGTALLPEIDKLLGKLTPMIQKWVDSGDAARETKVVLRDLGIAARAAFGIFKEGEHIFHDFADVVGGDRHAIELLTAAMIAFKLKGVAALVSGATAGVASLGRLGGVVGKILSAEGLIAAVGTLAQRGESQNTGRMVNGHWVVTFNGKTYTGPAVPGADGSGAPTTSRAGSAGDMRGSSATSNLATGRQKMLNLAASMIGTPYVWGGNAPGGFDCSGLVQWAFANGLHVNIPHSTYAQAGMGRQVPLSKAKPGDVVFTNYGEGGKAGPGHEGLYLGNGMVLQAPHSGDKVKISSLSAFTGGGAYTIRDLLASPLAHGGGGGGGASLAALLAQGTTTAKKHAAATGAHLLPSDLQIALARASGTTGLTDDKSALGRAISYLKGHETSKNRVQVEQELGRLQKQLNGVDKAIVDHVKAHEKALQAAAAKVKSTFAPQIAAAQQGISSAFSALENAAISALQAKYAAATPAEAKLAQMQAEDQAKQLQDALDQAIASGDQTQIEAAKRAIVENDLAIQAAKERAQANADEQLAEQKLVDQLGKFEQGLEKGTSKISALDSILKPFGISLADIPADELGYDMTNLQTAVQVLSEVMIAEAKALAKVGDNKDAQAIIDTLNPPNGEGPTSSWGPVRGKAIPMAAGGVGRVTGPTLFLAGEAGTEDFAFSGGGRSFGGGNLTVQFHGPVYGDKRAVARELSEEIWLALRDKQRFRGSSLGIG